MYTHEMISGLGPNHEAPVIRDSFQGAGSLLNSQPRGAPRRNESVKKGNAFLIYQVGFKEFRHKENFK